MDPGAGECPFVALGDDHGFVDREVRSRHKTYKQWRRGLARILGHCLWLKSRRGHVNRKRAARDAQVEVRVVVSGSVENGAGGRLHGDVGHQYRRLRSLGQYPAE